MEEAGHQDGWQEREKRFFKGQKRSWPRAKGEARDGGWREVPWRERTSASVSVCVCELYK